WSGENRTGHRRFGVGSHSARTLTCDVHRGVATMKVHDRDRTNDVVPDFRPKELEHEKLKRAKREQYIKERTGIYILQNHFGLKSTPYCRRRYGPKRIRKK